MRGRSSFKIWDTPLVTAAMSNHAPFVSCRVEPVTPNARPMTTAPATPSAEAVAASRRRWRRISERSRVRCEATALAEAPLALSPSLNTAAAAKSPAGACSAS
jgi:hypothetical protein